jgi:hypothetical protein
MFSTLRNLPGVYRQISLTPKYYYGDNKIVVIPDATKITQEEIFTSAVYQIETCASKVVLYLPPIGVEKEIPTDDVVSSIKRFYKEPEDYLTVYHSKNIFAVVRHLHTDIPFVMVAGYNYNYINPPPAHEIIEIRDGIATTYDGEEIATTNDCIDTVEDLLDFMSKHHSPQGILRQELPEDSQQELPEDSQ